MLPQFCLGTSWLLCLICRLDTQAETRIRCSHTDLKLREEGLSGDGHTRAPRYEQCLRPRDSRRCFPRFVLGCAAVTNSPVTSVVPKRHGFMFPSLYLTPAVHVPCLCSACFLHSGSRILACGSQDRGKKQRQGDVIAPQAFVRVWRTSHGFIRTKDRILCICPIAPNIHICTLKHHVLQHI